MSSCVTLRFSSDESSATDVLKCSLVTFAGTEKLMRSREPIISRTLPACGKVLPIALFFLFLAATGCSHQAAGNTVCPIDGQPSQWSRAENEHRCEYSHYSLVERKTHSWLAECQEGGAK